MTFSIDIGNAALATLVVGGLLFGIMLELVGREEFGAEWLITGLAAMLGGLVASEAGPFARIAPVWDGMAVLPAIAGLVLMGAIVDALVRVLTHGSYTHHAGQA